LAIFLQFFFRLQHANVCILHSSLSNRNQFKLIDPIEKPIGAWPADGLLYSVISFVPFGPASETVQSIAATQTDHCRFVIGSSNCDWHIINAIAPFLRRPVIVFPPAKESYSFRKKAPISNS
jgi:hypothetical protein